MSNITFGTGNIIDPIAINSLAAGENNTIKRGNAQMAFGDYNTINSGLSDSCIGSVNKIEISENYHGSDFANHCSGYNNKITTITGKIRHIGNNV